MALLNFCYRSFPCNNFCKRSVWTTFLCCAVDCVCYIKTLVCQMPFQKYEICFFIRKTCFVPDIFRFIYFHFLSQVVVIGEKVNGEIFLKIRRTSIVSRHESIYSLRNSRVHYINKHIYKYFGLNERSDN